MTSCKPQDDIARLARPELLDLVPYQSARRLEKGAGNFNNKIWLNANEASGPGIYQLSGDCLNRYPDFQPDNLLDGYSAYCGLDKSQILATRGADEGIELLIRTFCTAYQDNILLCPPTYGMYAISAENHGAGVIAVPLQQGALDVPAVINELDNAKVVFLCSPGNPTGKLLAQQDIIAVLEASQGKALVVVDEAYIEFCPEHSCLGLLAQYPNLVILRTLSKAFALAGLRCGFTLASATIIGLLSKVIAPYPVPAPVAQLASKALNTEGLLQMAFRVKESNYLREQLSQWLQCQFWCQQVFTSDANFILFRCEDKDLVFKALAASGILIRDQSKQPGLDNCLRVTIGSPREIKLLQQILNETLIEPSDTTSVASLANSEN